MTKPSKAKKGSQSPFTTLKYYTVKNLSSPEDVLNNRRVLFAQVPVTEIIGIPTDANVRDYLLEAEGRKRRRPGQVHREIDNTLENRPDDFSVLNGGIVLVARSHKIDEKRKEMVLSNASIINGSQTQGVIKDRLAKLKEAGIPDGIPAHVKVEIIVTEDDDLVAETSISRNFQNDVMTISIVGRRGQLDELENSLKEKLGKKTKLKKSETKLSDDYIKTEKLLQISAALVPEELWFRGKRFNKVYTYSQKTKCLKDFQKIYLSAKDPNAKDHEHFKKLYKFYLDIPAQALEIYEKWKCHAGFEGSGIRSIEREGRKIVNVPDGIIFPIIASLSAFARETSEGWQIQAPDFFDEIELIEAAKGQYIDVAKSNPWNMGKNLACYSSLLQITSIYRKLDS